MISRQMKKTMKIGTFMLAIAGMALGFGAQDARAEATKYPLWFGSTQVTSENKDDLPTEKGKASYDPDTHTLTLEDYASPDGLSNNSQIRITGDQPLTIEGKGYFIDEDAEYGLKVDTYTYDSKITLIGELNFSGSKRAIYTYTGDLECNGNITATVRTDDSSGFEAIYSSGNITVTGGTVSAYRTDGPGTAICADRSFTLESGTVMASSANSGDAVESANITINGGAMRAYANDGRAVYGYSADGVVNVNDGLLIAESKETGPNTGAVRAEKKVSVDSKVQITTPEGGQVSPDDKSITKPGESTVASRAVLAGPSCHWDTNKYELDLSACSLSEYAEGTEMLWNTLLGCSDYNYIWSESQNKDRTIIRYDIDKNGYYDIEVHKTNDGCKVYPLGGTKNFLSHKATDHSLIIMEGMAIKAGAEGPYYYTSLEFDMPVIYDFGTYDLNFVLGGGTVTISRLTDIAKVTNTLKAAAAAGDIKIQATPDLSEMRIDADKDGKIDFESKYDGTESVITWQKDGSIKENTLMSLSDAAKQALDTEGEAYYSSLNLLVQSQYNKGEYTIDLSSGSAQVPLAVVACFYRAFTSGKIAVLMEDESSGEFVTDLDMDGTYDLKMSAVSSTEMLVTVLEGNKTEGVFDLYEMTDEETADLEYEEQDYYQHVLIRFTPPTDEEITAETLAKTSTDTVTSESGAITFSWNSFVTFDGRKHFGVGVDGSGKPASAKSSPSKAYDVKVTVAVNGQVIDPSKYSIKIKNNKAASVSIDGITPIITNQKKLPAFKIKFKGKEFAAVNKAMKNKTFSFGIIPAKLTKETVIIGSIKRKSDGSVSIKGITYKPSAATGATKSVKLKFSKKDNKTDYIATSDASGKVTITGRNNFYGSVTAQAQ